MKGSNPTKTDKQLWTKLADLGCIACRIDGIHSPHVSIHHIDGRTKPGAHQNVIPLCGPHHQTGGEEAPSIHPWKARFEAKYGKQEQLRQMCMELIKC
jgi:hypothetical protein